jgi:hypothetical protein
MCTTCDVFILLSKCSTPQQMSPLVQGHLTVVWAETKVMQEGLSSECSYITGNTILILKDTYKLQGNSGYVVLQQARSILRIYRTVHFTKPKSGTVRLESQETKTDDIKPDE